MGCKCATPVKPGSVTAAEHALLEGDFKVSITRQNETDDLGVRIETHGTSYAKILLISDSGLIADWNMRNINTQELIKEGDIIVAINGKNGSIDLLQDELKKESVTLSLKHGSAREHTTEVRPAGEDAVAEPAAEPISVEIEEVVQKENSAAAENPANEGATTEAIEAPEDKQASDEQPPIRAVSATLGNETDLRNVDLEPNAAREPEHPPCCVFFGA
eukprot:TRINITY_DN1933_c0_g1_i1.p1 TRINITY_DN1933_c0_g1~~TRINITY_DN1933_c0_g1_i1.p1  ORF type:complete len:218 (-),score=50.20 TRINITY_DN1933_c0_g1_i1:142-795(-)